MPKYEVEVYELWTQKFTVEADNPIAAAEGARNAEGELCDDGLTFIEVADAYKQALANSTGGVTLIPGIRSVELADDNDEEDAVDG